MWTTKVMTGTAIALLSRAIAILTTKPVPLPGLDGLRSYDSQEAQHQRQVFFVGGKYQTDPTTNLTLFVNQMYTEQLIPANGVKHPNPLIFFHGGAFSGATWLQTPDNRQGWASYFLDQGYAVFLVDVVSVGRSSRLPPTAITGATPVELAEAFFSASEKFPTNYPQAKLHTQWPGVSLLPTQPPVSEAIRCSMPDAWYPSLIQVPVDNAATEEAVAIATCDLLSRIPPSFLIVHSYGGLFPWVIADKCPKAVQGIFGIEPSMPPFVNFGNLGSGPPTPARPYGLTDAPITYDPPVVNPTTDLKKVTVGTDSPANRSCILQANLPRTLPNLIDIPVYIYTTPSSIHVTYDHCLIAYLRQAGVKDVTWQLLQDIGIYGNGHFSFIEKNNLVIASLALEWLKGKETQKH